MYSHYLAWPLYDSGTTIILVTVIDKTVVGLFTQSVLEGQTILSMQFTRVVGVFSPVKKLDGFYWFTGV